MNQVELKENHPKSEPAAQLSVGIRTNSDFNQAGFEPSV